MWTQSELFTLFFLILSELHLRYEVKLQVIDLSSKLKGVITGQQLKW